MIFLIFTVCTRCFASILPEFSDKVADIVKTAAKANVQDGCGCLDQKFLSLFKTNLNQIVNG